MRDLWAPLKAWRASWRRPVQSTKYRQSLYGFQMPGPCSIDKYRTLRAYYMYVIDKVEGQEACKKLRSLSNMGLLNVTSLTLHVLTLPYLHVKYLTSTLSKLSWLQGQRLNRIRIRQVPIELTVRLLVSGECAALAHCAPTITESNN